MRGVGANHGVELSPGGFVLGGVWSVASFLVAVFAWHGARFHSDEIFSGGICFVLFQRWVLFSVFCLLLGQEGHRHL